MAENYAKQREKDLVLVIREMLKQMPVCCSGFLSHITPNTQPLTRFAYLNDIRIFCQFLLKEIPEFADKEMTTLRPADFEDVTVAMLHTYMDYLAYYVQDDIEFSNDIAGSQRKMSALRRFYDYLFKSEQISADVTRLVELPKRRHDKPILRLEIEEMVRLLDSVESGELQTEHQRKYNDNVRLRDTAIITLFLGTGIRVSELVGLDIEDIDFSINGFLVTRKGGYQAVLYFPEEVADVLKRYLAERANIEALPGHENALFLSLQRKRIGVRAVENMVKKYATAVAPLKKRLSPHKLRSTFATNLYHETGDIYLVAETLGHSDVNTTRKHYAAMTDDLRREAAKHVILREEPPK